MLLVYRCYDRITGNPSQPKSIICGVIDNSLGRHVLKDGEVLRVLNELANTIKPTTDADPVLGVVAPGDRQVLSQSEALLREAFPTLDLSFRQPDLELLGIVAWIA